MASQEDPYPPNSFFAVHKGFKPGVYTTFRDLRAQTEGFNNKIFAVFNDVHHAEVYAKTGRPPPGVEPLVPNTARRLSQGPPFPAQPSTSSRSTAAPKPKLVVPTATVAQPKPIVTRAAPTIPAPLPTPSVSPDRSVATPFISASQPARPRTPDAGPVRAYASQPYHSNRAPATPPKSVKPEDVDMDEGGDTEPEVDNRSLPPISHAPARPTTPPAGGPVRHTQSAITPGTRPVPLGRSIPRGSIAEVLKRQASAGAVFPQITIGTSPAPSAHSAGSSKLVKQESIVHNPTALSTPDPTPAPRANHKRMRPCTSCHGTGQVPYSDSESESGRDAKVTAFKRSTGSPTLERRPKRLSDGKRPEARDAKLKAKADKGKSKAYTTERMDAGPSTYARDKL